MRVRNVSNPTIMDYPSDRAIPVVGARGYQNRVGPGSYESGKPGGFQYPPVRAVGLGADDISMGGKGAAGYGYSQKVDLDREQGG